MMRILSTALTLLLASPSLLGLSINDFSFSQCSPGEWVSFVVPRRSVRAGVNVIALQKLRFEPKDVPEMRTDVMSLTIEPLCVADR